MELEIFISVPTFIELYYSSSDYIAKNCMYYKYLPQIANPEP